MGALQKVAFFFHAADTNLDVSVAVSPVGTVHAAGSSISLSCVTKGGQPPLSYFWGSTCSSCFVLDQSTEIIMHQVLHSRDSGVHTCRVSDFAGRDGIASTNVTVEGLLNQLSTQVVNYLLSPTGVGINLNGKGVIKNNSIILATASSHIGAMECVSGSRTANVGMWIAPNRTDITNIANDAFDVFVGGNSDPGHIVVTLKSGYALHADDVGVYSCIIPDEAGVLQQINIAIYLSTFTGL